MWTDAFHTVGFHEKEKMLFFHFISPIQKSVSFKSFSSSRSSSQQELQPVEDLRAERAAIALSVGLSWPPDRYTKTPRGRPSRQQLWERALQDHIMNRHELPQGISLQRPAWWRPGEEISFCSDTNLADLSNICFILDGMPVV